MPLTKVTRGALTADIIDSTKLADNAVDTEHLADDAVESAEIGENITFTGKYIGLPVFANNAARDHAETGITSPASGMMCFNTAQAAVQQYTGTSWSDIAPAPTFSGFASGYAVINEDSDVTIKIDGGQFAAGMTVDMVNNANDTNVTNYGGLSYTLVSAAQISISIGAATNNITSGTVVYFNITKGGIAVKTSTITVEADPVWVTNAGTLTTSPTTTWDNVSSGNIVTLSATSSTGAVTYTTSNLDSEFSLSSAGVISVASAITDVSGGYPATRTESFDVNAITDGIAEAATSRAFNIIVAGYIEATGGTITTYGSYRVHTFTNTGNTTFTVNETLSCDILVVAGGGGGGAWDNRSSGGGGAGGYRTASGHTVTPQGYTVVVGSGGTGGDQNSGTKGSDSTFDTITATGGGFGGGNPAGTGGSGGGGNHGGCQGGSGNEGNYTPAEGFDGGDGVGEYPYNGAGGGGASAAGANSSVASGSTAGGAGATNDYRTGSNVTYAGGGGGGGGTAAAGGVGGGGAGATSGTGTSGTANTGGGGGGGGGSSAIGGGGGSGIVVIRYAI